MMRNLVYVPNEEYPERWKFSDKLFDYCSQPRIVIGSEIRSPLRSCQYSKTVINCTTVIAGYMVNIKSHYDGPLVFG